ncbi:TPA: DUF3560 domain-containing protein [Pseudomonas aeruginosa]
MNHHQEIQSQKPAQASSKAMFDSQNPKTGRTAKQAELQHKALTNAVTGESMANYQAIFEGFAAMGIDPDDVKPRENVFTFNAWKALGRVVKKGQHGVRIVTVIPCTKKDEQTGEEVAVKKPKTTTVFHISQTEPLDGPRKDDDSEAQAEQPAKIEDAPAAEESAQAAPDAAEAIEAEERPLNRYEQRLADKKARYEERAERAARDSESTYRKARQMGEAIPFGQPILVGHHSEKRDRNYRDRIHNTYGKAFSLQDKAKHYEQKAASVGTGGISSDDPDAIEKLRAELASMEAAQERMKAANKAIRTNKTAETQAAALVALGFSEKQAAQLLEKDFCGRIGFPDYALTNNNGNMRRVKGRIAELEKRRQRADVERTGQGFTYREDTEENRVMFVFDGKPDEATREILRSHGFRFSPSRDGKPWVRQLNNAGIWNGQRVFEALNAARNGDNK